MKQIIVPFIQTQKAEQNILEADIDGILESI